MKAKASKKKRPAPAPVSRRARFGAFQDRVVLTLASLFLGATTFIWSYLGAVTANSNADQLVDPYLFTSWETFQGAVFPAAHSMLFKWPLFWAVAQTGLTATNLIVWTILVCLTTVGGLAWLVSRIERRPYYLATLFTLIGFILLLIPAQPYAGGLLPVNMAMLTTRNLEYLLFIAGLALVVRRPRVISWPFVAGCFSLILLFASDRLFIAMSLGGAILLALIAGLSKRRAIFRLATRVLLAVVIAAIGGSLAIFIINKTGLTTISDGGSASPYGLNLHPTSLLTAAIYAVLNTLTNLGANPAFDGTIVRSIPQDVERRLFSYPGLVYGFSLALTGYILYVIIRQIGRLMRRSEAEEEVTTADGLSLILISTSVAATIIFVVTNHYYAVDARYLAISLFAAVVSLAAYTRRRTYRPALVLTLLAIAVVMTVPAVQLAHQTSHQQAAGTSAVDERNEYIAAVLNKYKVNTLVGDYWRVLPTRLASADTLTVTPLADCQTPRDVLTSRAWQPDLQAKPFAYLLPLEKGLTDYPACRADAVIKVYGRPNATITIKGSLDKPEEQLLIYTAGIRKKAPSKPQSQTGAAIVPTALSALPDMSCRTGQTFMNITAHQDDDILFMNPDLLHTLDQNQCVRSVYLTAGDAGADQLYWLSRRLGSQAAYESMTGHKYTWVERTVKTQTGQFITLVTPRENHSISLIFINLPDGNTSGSGFNAYHNESLAKLENGSISRITSVDGQSTYTLDQLRSTLAQLMRLYEPAEIRTQSDVVGNYYRDHSDHLATSRITEQATTATVAEVPIRHYIGYPIHGLPVNVSGDDLERKQAAFMAYGQHDGGVCHDSNSCANSAYGAYLLRQYQQ